MKLKEIREEDLTEEQKESLMEKVFWTNTKVSPDGIGVIIEFITLDMLRKGRIIDE